MGYEGDLKLALIPESFRTDILKETLDDNGVLIKKILTDGNATAFISMNKNGAFAYIKNIWQNS